MKWLSKAGCGRRSRRFVCVLGLLVAALVDGSTVRAEDTEKRARLPDFQTDGAVLPFFKDLFSQLKGERPGGASGGKPSNRVEPSVTGKPVPAGPRWSESISPTTIADEVKALKIAVDEAVRTPSDFAARGFQLASRDFSLLATLFGIIAEYDAEVRFKHSAAVARDRFSRAAASAEAGGSTAVFNEAKLRKRDLQDLVNGTRLIGDARDLAWESIASRRSLMQRLEVAAQERLAAWTRDSSEFARRQESVLHEGEMVAAIAVVLTRNGMEDSADEEYAEIAGRMRAAAMELVAAVKRDDSEQARGALGRATQACSDCHDLYR